MRAVLRAFALSVCLLAVLPLNAVGHDMTGAPYSASWAGKVNDGPSDYKYSSTPDWLKTVMDSVLLGSYEDAATNNSDSIRFDRVDASGRGTVWMSTRYADGVPSDCYGDNWQGCANGAGSWSWNIWIRQGEYIWCQSNPDNLPCRDSGRVGIHEVGHVAGFLAHSHSGQPPTQANTVMQAGGVPWKPLEGWNTRTLQRCDAAQMQWLYDLADKAGPYAPCFDHVPDACGPPSDPEGLCTHMVAPSDTYACGGIPFTISGRIEIAYKEYGRKKSSNPDVYELDGNALGGRTVTIDRNGAAYTTTVATTGGGDNWSKTLTLSNGGNGNIVYNFTAQFIRPPGAPGPMHTGLSSSAVKSWTITVIPGHLC